MSAEKVTGVTVVDDPSGAKLLVEPKVETYAFVPSCVTFASTSSNLLFVESVMEMKYFALLTAVLLKLVISVTAELETGVDPSAIVEWLRVAPAVAKDRTPDPLVVMNWPTLPSVVGILNPLMSTLPEPFADSSKFALEAFVDMVLSVIVTPSITADVLAVTVVKVPATAVVAPISAF